MPFLIDGDNLLGTWPGRGRTARDKRDLVRRLARLPAAGEHVVVAFDGFGSTRSLPGVIVTFSGAGSSADEALLDRLRTEPVPAAWTVVTSDRSLADRCRHLGAEVLRSDLFRRQLADPAPPSESSPSAARRR